MTPGDDDRWDRGSLDPPPSDDSSVGPGGGDVLQPDEVHGGPVTPGEGSVLGDRTPAGPSSFPPEGPNSLASIGQRAGARLIDSVILMVPFLLIVLPNVEVSEDEAVTDIPVSALLIAMAVAAIYEVVLIALRGQTLGKQAMGIRVATLDDGSVPSWWSASVRWLLPAVAGMLPLVQGFASVLVYLSALWNPLRRGWHDLAAGTVVIRTR